MALVGAGLLPKLEKIAQGGVGANTGNQRDNILKGTKNSRHLRILRYQLVLAVDVGLLGLVSVHWFNPT